MEFLPLTFRPKDSSIQYLRINRPQGYRAQSFHMHDLEELLYITSASTVELVSNGKTFFVATPALVIHRAGTYHETVSSRPEEKEFQSQVLFFRPEIFSFLPEKLSLQSLLAPDCRILPLTKDETADFALAEKETSQSLLFLLLSILFKIRQLLEKGHACETFSTKERYIFRVIPFLIEHFSEKIPIEKIAEKFHISPGKLKADFKNITGQSIKNFVLEIRYRHAAELLEEGGELCDIAYTCGFSSESHFVSSFHRFFGVTPGVYREKALSQHDNRKDSLHS